GVVLEYEQAVIRTNALYFSLQGRGYLARDSVRDNRDPLLRFQSKTNIDRVTRTRDKLRINRMKIGSIGHTKVLRITRKSRPAKSLHFHPEWTRRKRRFWQNASTRLRVGSGASTKCLARQSLTIFSSITGSGSAGTVTSGRRTCLLRLTR